MHNSWENTCLIGKYPLDFSKTYPSNPGFTECLGIDEWGWFGWEWFVCVNNKVTNRESVLFCQKERFRKKTWNFCPGAVSIGALKPIFCTRRTHLSFLPGVQMGLCMQLAGFLLQFQVGKLFITSSPELLGACLYTADVCFLSSGLGCISRRGAVCEWSKWSLVSISIHS